MEETAYDKGYEKGYAEAIEVVRKTKVTPTQEQIEKIDKVWGNTFGMVWDITSIEDLIKVTITEWEKIRNRQ